jgi:hypothetical protein
LERITENSTIIYKGKRYKVLGKTLYTTQNDPKSVYAKMLLEGHHVLVVSPEDKIAYFGKNEGKLASFDSFGVSIDFDGKIFEQVNRDYQIVLKIEFGFPLDIEGEVEYWDYEAEDMIISIAIVSRTKERADVVARYITFDDIEVC